MEIYVIFCCRKFHRRQSIKIDFFRFAFIKMPHNNTMIPQKIRLLFFLLAFAKFTAGQRIGTINFDTSLCQRRSLNLKEAKVLSALSGAEHYIQSIIGHTITQNNIWFDCFQSVENPVMRYSKNFSQYQYLGTDTCYALYYYVMDHNKRIGEFYLLADRFGKITRDEYDSKCNRPELIFGYKKYFSGDFKFAYYKVLQMAKKRGITTEPTLECEIDNSFLSNGIKEAFAKIKYYWSFLQTSDGGNQAILKVNAYTGQIELEQYIPRMPQ